MIDFIETSKSNKSRCKGCGKLIGKGTPRGVVFQNRGNYTSAFYYCYKCSPLIIEKTIQEQKKIKKDLTRKKLKCKKELILMELGNENR